MRKLLLFAMSIAAVRAAAPGWVDLVAPLLTSTEKKTYLSLSPEERATFEKSFWADKSITADEYFQRVQYIDVKFGSGKPGSGFNTDEGRVYLSLGPPSKIMRLPSSRILVPLDIWYYDTVPALHLQTELRLIFYRKNSIGFPKLYSPVLDTIRALLVPESATVHMFGPNDSVTEADIRTNITLPPAEDEVISAASNIATGIKYSGNDEILGQIMSPRAMLTRDLKAEVTSRFITDRPKLQSLATPSPYGGSQVDFAVELTAEKEISVEVLDGPISVYKNVLNLRFDAVKPVEYLHRLDLLPGSYRLLVGVDGKTYPYLLDVPAQPQASDIVLMSEARAVSSVQTPYEFDGRHFYPAQDGQFAVLAMPQRAEVNWVVRRGLQVVWKQKTDAAGVAVLAIPFSTLGGGRFQLEASTAASGATQRIDVDDRPGRDDKTSSTLLSFNGNLSAASREALVGHQYLLRGKLAEAVQSLNAAIRKAAVKEAQVDLARIDALAGRYDQGRDRLRPILAVNPSDFDALSVYAYIEARLQDYPVAAEYYHRALAVQDSPALRLALAKLPK